MNYGGCEKGLIVKSSLIFHTILSLRNFIQSFHVDKLTLFTNLQNRLLIFEEVEEFFISSKT